MNLSGVKLEKQDDEAFHLRDDSGPFKVYKKATSKGLLDAIHQHFAKGGEMQDEDLAALASGNHSALDGAGGLGNTNPLLAQSQDADLASLAKGNSKALSGASLEGGASFLAPALSPQQDARLTNILAMHQPSHIQPPPEAAPPTAGPPAPIAPQAPPAPQARPQGMGGGSLVSDKQIADSFRQQEKAAQEAAKVAGQHAEANALASQHLLAAQQEEHQRAAQEFAANKAEQEKTKQDITNTKISPDNWWQTRTGGQRASGIVGLILGGLGQAFGGGPNIALELIQKHIGMDIDAQKANLGKKQTQLGDLMKQGYSIQDAEKLAQAHAMAVYQGMLAKSAADFGSPEAMANAQKEMAAMEGDRLRLTEDVHQRRFQNSIEARKLQIEAAAKGLGKPLMEQDVGKLAAQKDAPEVIRHIADLQKDVGLSGLLGAVTPEGLHFGAQRQLDNAVNAASGPLSVAAFPLARTESPELTKMVKEQMPTGWQSSEAAQKKLQEMLTNIHRASDTKLTGLAAGGGNPAEINALRIRDASLSSQRVPVIGPDGKRYSVDESEVSALPKGFRRAN